MDTKKILTYITSGLVLLLFAGCGLINSKSTQNKAYTAWMQINSDLPTVNGDQTLTQDQTVSPVNYTGGIGGQTSGVLEEQIPPDVQPVSMETFQDTLSNYGQFVEINKDEVDPDYINQDDNSADESVILSDYGTSTDYVTDDNSGTDVDINFSVIWVPYSNYECEDWNPYINGRWMWTPYGYQWVSNYHWGYGPYHYGRWWHSRHYGWVWSPGNRWRSSWTRWCVNDGYIGWHPISPREHHHEGYNGEENTGNRHPISIDPRWVFVKKQDFTKEINTSVIQNIDVRSQILDNPKTVIVPVQINNNTSPVQKVSNIDNTQVTPNVQKPLVQNTDRTHSTVMPKTAPEKKVGGSTTITNSRKITTPNENGKVTLPKTDPKNVSVKRNNNTNVSDNKNVNLSKTDPKNISVNRKNTKVIETKNGTLSKKDPNNSGITGNKTGIVTKGNKNSVPVNKVNETKGNMNKSSDTYTKNTNVNKSNQNRSTVPANKNTEVTKGSQNKSNEQSKSSWSIIDESKNKNSAPKTNNENVTKGSQNKTKESYSSDNWSITKSSQNNNTQPKTQNVTKNTQKYNTQPKTENVTKSYQNNNSSSNYKPYTPPVNNNSSYKTTESKPKVNYTPPPVKQETYNSNKNNNSNSKDSPVTKQKGNND